MKFKAKVQFSLKFFAFFGENYYLCTKFQTKTKQLCYHNKT